jgi:PmbA protein
MSADESLTLLADLIAKAKGAGADAADALLVDGASISVSFRLGKPEQVERGRG